MLSESSCGPLCQHPTCWHSVNQQLKGVRRRQVELKDNLTDSDSSDEEDALPTQKVYNMLDDYGCDKRDRYPSKHKGRPKERRASAEPMPYGMSLRTGTTAPYTTPNTMSGGPRKFASPQITAKAVKKIPQFNKVEVQELFDLDDLQKDWHETFYASKCYVWVPGKKRTPRSPEAERMTISKLSQGPVPLPTKDLTESMVPLELELERQRESERSLWPILWPSVQRRHLHRSTSPRRPRSIKTRYVNLLDLPRDILRAVLESLEQSNDLTREEVQNALLQVVPEFSRHDTALTLTSSSILRQQKVKLVDGQKRNVRQPELYQTKPAFVMDMPEPPPERNYELESVISSNREIRSLSEYPLGQGKKRMEPLPPLRAPSPKSKNKMTSISLGLPEIPTGYKFTKPFTYYKGNELDFALAPVTSIAPSERETITRESDVESTLHVTIPTIASERDDLEYTFRQRSPGEILHHVSPADSTNVPKTPAATPASRSKASGAQGPESQSSQDVIQLPVHAPPTSPVSMGASTNLGPIREISFNILPDTEKAQQLADLQNSHNQLKSRGGRSVHFAPGVVTPTTTPADGDAETSVANRATNQTPATDTGTFATSMAVTGAQISRTINPSPGTEGPVLVIKDKDSSVASSPELWPVVNEEEYLKSPEPSPTAQLEEKSQPNETPDSKFANLDERSVKALTTPNARSEPSPAIHPDILKLLPDSDFSPAPPPPSPEMRQNVLQETEESPSPDKLERRSTKELSMLPVLEEEHTDGNVTDRTDGTAGEPTSMEQAQFMPPAGQTQEDVVEYANMANNAISDLMSKIGDNFSTPEQLMADFARQNSAANAKALEEENQEMTEDGGDHDGFKQDLEEELGNLDTRMDSEEGKEEDGEGSEGKGGGLGAWNWVK